MAVKKHWIPMGDDGYDRLFDGFFHIFPDVPTIFGICCFFGESVGFFSSGFRKIPQDQVNKCCWQWDFSREIPGCAKSILCHFGGNPRFFDGCFFRWENHDILWWLVGYTIPDLLPIFVSKSTIEMDNFIFRGSST